MIRFGDSPASPGLPWRIPPDSGGLHRIPADSRGFLWIPADSSGFRWIPYLRGFAHAADPWGQDFSDFLPKSAGFGVREGSQRVRTAISCKFLVSIPRDLSPGPENGQNPEYVISVKYRNLDFPRFVIDLVI